TPVFLQAKAIVLLQSRFLTEGAAVRVSRRMFRVWMAAVVAGGVATAGAAGATASIRSQDVREWLTYIASDELQGRAGVSSGFGLAAAYIADHLRAWDVKPAGDPGQYLQTVRVLGVKTTSHSTITVEVNGESNVFADGSGVTFPKNMGGKQRLVLDRVEFAGYGLDAPAAGHVDFRNTNVRGAALVWLGARGPKDIDQAAYRRLLTGRNRYATEQLGAGASIGPAPEPGQAGRAGQAARAGGSGGSRGDGGNEGARGGQPSGAGPSGTGGG